MWLLPSRRRIANLQRFFAAYNTTGGTTPGMVIVDHQDWADNNEAYLQIEETLPVNWHFAQTAGETQGDKLRELWPVLEGCAWLGLIGDDCVPETPGWDQLLVHELDCWNLVSCNDGWQAPKRLGNCWIMSGPLVRAVGYIFPPGMHHLYVDNVWETIGNEAKCWSCRMDVMVRHLHVLKGEAEADETHDKVYGEQYAAAMAAGGPREGLWPVDFAAFMDWCDGPTSERDIAIDAARKLQMLAAPAIVKSDQSGDRARLEYAKTRSVLFVTPIFQRPAWQFTDSFCNTRLLMERLGIRHERIWCFGSSNLPSARNELVARALVQTHEDGYYTDAMMIDDDMGWDPTAVLRLLASKHPVIAGVGRKRIDKPNSDPAVWCAYFQPGEPLITDGEGAWTCESGRLKVGGAFLRVTREALLTMQEAHPEWKRPGKEHMSQEVKDRYYQLFRFDPDEQSDGGEDYTFCERWWQFGKVWFDPAIILGHVGEKEYRGSIGELMRPIP